MKKPIFTTLALILALLFTLSACTTTGDPAGTTPPQATEPAVTDGPDSPFGVLTVTDLMGNEITIDGPVEKIVSLTASNTEILFALGLGDKVIGRDDFSFFPDAAASIPVMGDYNGPNIETIVESGADVVFTSTKLQTGAIERLRELGVTVVASEATTFDGIIDSIALIGKACGVEEAAQALIADMRDRIQAVKDAVNSERSPRVYYCMSFGEYGDWTGGDGSFINDIMRIAGGTCVTDDIPVPWANLSVEQIAERDPEIIFLSTFYTAEELAAAPGYGDTAAVKNGKVYLLNPDIVERPGPRIIDALEQIAEAIRNG